MALGQEIELKIGVQEHMSLKVSHLLTKNFKFRIPPNIKVVINLLILTVVSKMWMTKVNLTSRIMFPLKIKTLNTSTS